MSHPVTTGRPKSVAKGRNRPIARSAAPPCRADDRAATDERSGAAGKAASPSGGLPQEQTDNADRLAAFYLVRRLGPDASHYVRRVADRLREVGKTDRADEWAAIGDAIEEHESTEGSS